MRDGMCERLSCLTMLVRLGTCAVACVQAHHLCGCLPAHSCRRPLRKRLLVRSGVDTALVYLVYDRIVRDLWLSALGSSARYEASSRVVRIERPPAMRPPSVRTDMTVHKMIEVPEHRKKRYTAHGFKRLACKRKP
jgi:hypothetical protein